MNKRLKIILSVTLFVVGYFALGILVSSFFLKTDVSFTEAFPGILLWPVMVPYLFLFFGGH